MKIVNPLGGQQASSLGLAARLPSLRGMVIGVLDNRKENADVVLQSLVEEIERRGDGPRFVFFRKNYPAEPAHNIDEVVGGCDAVINGIGH